MSDWTLGIDFGTSYTVAAIAQDGATRTIDVESGGRDRMPSAVFLTDSGEIVVGAAAQHQAKFAPERYEPSPKRSLGEGELFLGDRLVAIEDLIGAILRSVYTEACRQQGERMPDAVRLTFPADWAQPRRDVLIEAAARGGLPEPELLAEPVAAAVKIALAVTPPDRHIAVYDFGGGTFDAAVLLRTADGFEVAGPPAGRDPLGGEDIDQRVIAHLGELLAAEHPEEWAKLLDPPDAEWRGLASELRSEVQRAKETLSDVEAAQLWIPGIKRDVQLTRDELNGLIGADIDATIDTLEAALSDASVTPNDLAGLYLVGGSSRIPLVADRLWRRLGVQPAVQDNPKSVVATGAAIWSRQLPRGSGGAAGGNGYSTRLAAHTDPVAWPRDCSWATEVLIDRPFGEPLTIRLRDDPAAGADTDAVARAARSRRVARTAGFAELGAGQASVLGIAGGIERRFTMTVRGAALEMFEQYVVVGGRALVVICPEAGRDLAAAVTLAESEDGGMGARFELGLPEGWTATERLSLWHEPAMRSVVAERVIFAPDATPGSWLREEIEQLYRQPQTRVVDRVPATVLNSVDGEVITGLWQQAGTPMITKLGVGARDGLGFALTIILPHRDQALFAPLARSVSLLD